jgi:hypothetical protein
MPHDPYDPAALLERTRHELAYARDLLVRVAQDLEQLAGQPGRSASDKGVLLRRAAHLRARLHQGPPAGWTGEGAAGSDRSDED